MVNSQNQKFTFRAVVFSMIVTVALPVFALADPMQGHGRNKKDVFVNGHDARDGRYDDRGPQSDDKQDRKRDKRELKEAQKREKFEDKQERKNDKYEDKEARRQRHRSDRDDRDRDRDRDRNNNYNRPETRRIAVENGYREGFRAGQDDRSSGRSYGYRDDSAYRDGTIGYSDSYGNRSYYQTAFRDGFRRGYEDGFRNRTSRRNSNSVGGVLGNILGRP